MVDEIGVEREGLLEFGHGSVVLALAKQDHSKLSASLRQACVNAHGLLRQFMGAIERSRTEIIAIVRFDISVHMSL